MTLEEAFEQGLVKLGDTIKYATDEYVVTAGPNPYGVEKIYAKGPLSSWISNKAKIIVPAKEVSTNKPDGGPSAYYDFPFKDWTTVNDMVEYLARKQWKEHSWIFKDILKACTRWGSKDGTTETYDAKKIIYYGLRLLMSVSDKATVQDYLKQLQEDKQFQ